MTADEIHVVYRTPCGHEIEVKPVMRVGGVMEGKWACKIKGPKASGFKSGIKTVYSKPNEDDAKSKSAAFLNISPTKLERVLVGEFHTINFKTNNTPSQATSVPVVSPSIPPRTTVLPSMEKKIDPIVLERNELKEALRLQRQLLAENRHVPAYCIYNDHTLNELVTKTPLTQTELLSIHGMGLVKCQQYGNDILQIIKEDRQHYCHPHCS